MRALVRGPGGVALIDVAAPEPAPGEVVIDVAYAGVCRSDLAAADGDIAVAPGRVLGHELAGRVRAVGAGVASLAPGDRVTAVPFWRCGACGPCAAGARCDSPRWLGVDADGAFAEQVRVPAACAVRIPDSLPLARGAYVEPVAAALGVLPFVGPGARVLVGGGGRIAELTARVARAQGATVARLGAAPAAGGPAEGQGARVGGAPGSGRFDVVIEHGGDVAPLLAALRPGGALILKSRARRPVTLDAGELVARDLIVRGASHGSFADAIEWLRAGRIAVDDLLAPARPLAAFAEVLAAARASEAQKQLFAIAPEREPAGPREPA